MKSRILIILLLFFVLGIFWECEKSTEPEKPKEQEEIGIPTEPLSSWIYRDSTFYFVSGVAEQYEWFFQEPIEGITVYLTNQDINCLDSPIDGSSIGGAWVIIEFPRLEVRDYEQITGCMSYWEIGVSYSNTSGNLGSSGLTFVDTTEEKRIQGWINFEEIGFFEEGEVCRAYGTFDVPFCSTELDSAYIPSEPILNWTYRDSTYPIVSGIAEHRRSYQGELEDGIMIFLTDLDISCTNSPFAPPDSGATITIKFPEITTRTYRRHDIESIFKVCNDGIETFSFFELPGLAGLTFVDTLEVKQVRGWLIIENEGTPYVNVYGTFDVPYCPVNP